ncbi:hypothetical protein [Hymenobacter terricola]|uniref:hypothetical protein n=1 Tax=Hymenobacter terricola TaxID=2819236 RepID=UPI001B310B71|nr:hypothetical protein [Hymenobacter terricola]
MHLHLPRRHRRKLLFPPGLLALAGLLWLGCVALSSHPEQLKRHSVMQLTMPPLSSSDIIWPMPHAYGYAHREPQLRYSTLPHLRTWFTVEFGQGPALDNRAAHEIKMALRSLALGSDDLPTSNGLRVVFGAHARYASLVLVLDLMNQHNIRKYFFDARDFRNRTSFYAFNGSLHRQRWTDPLLSTPPSPPAALDELLLPPAPLPQPDLWSRLTATNWWPQTQQLSKSWQLLARPEWSWVLHFLMLLTACSAWRSATFEIRFARYGKVPNSAWRSTSSRW